jgi:tRNA(Ile)-lysidine synthase
MRLIGQWAAEKGRARPTVLTVDHGLQKGSAANARKVLGWAKAAGLEAHCLTWKGDKPASNLEAEARRARYRLLGQWCKAHDVAALYLAHTRDDQAETFLLRLARGSGLDGLAAMRPLANFPEPGFDPVRVARPLLDFDGESLREFLSVAGQTWIEDPMNSDPRFDRVRIRGAMASLAGVGLTAARIADAAAHLRRARDALDEVTAAVLRRACRPDGDGVIVDARALFAAPREVGLRALAKLLMAVSGQPYRPRFERLERLFDSISAGQLGGGRTLHGCWIGPAAGGDARFGSDFLRVEAEKGRAEPKPAVKASKRPQARRRSARSGRRS